MRQLPIRADDIGCGYAANPGIARTIDGGLARSAGLMPNMPEAERGWEWVRDPGAAIGQHTNPCLGMPRADPVLIPSLLDGRGRLRSSRDHRAARDEGTESADHDGLAIEIEAQLARLRRIAGREPEHFEAHAVRPKNLLAAVHDVARRHGLRGQPMSLGPTITVRCGRTDVRMACEGALPPGRYDPVGLIRRIVGGMVDGDAYVLVFHPGYLDAFILDNSSLAANRAREVDAPTSPAMREWLGSQPDLRPVDHRDL